MHYGSGVIGTVLFIFDCDANVELIIVGPDDKQAFFCSGYIQGEVWDAFFLVSTIFGKGNLKWSQKSIFKNLIIIENYLFNLCKINDILRNKLGNSQRIDS